ncbi:MAG: Disulfide bond formation protein D [candidate division WS2 bacterium]|nr:Disulfide bond formation protein D [Candidatus Lithacetigena glycinireducens]
MLKKFLLAGVIITFIGSGALIYLNKKEEPKTTQGAVGTVVLEEQDHFLGSRSAPVKIVEYSGVECPYCKKLHPILLRILNEYKDQVALVYRHFPLTIHPKSFIQAQALECVAETNGDPGFFEYLDKLYEATPSNNNFDLALLPRLAEEMGIQEEKFAECLASGRHRARILRDVESGIWLNVDSTPHLIVVSPNGREFVFGRSPSYAALKAVIETALSDK